VVTNKNGYQTSNATAYKKRITGGVATLEPQIRCDGVYEDLWVLIYHSLSHEALASRYYNTGHDRFPNTHQMGMF
jgi:hypothetical protein